MYHWKSYLASFLLVLTVGLLWLFASQPSEARWRDRHPNGIIARVAANREARWQRIQAWHNQHDGHHSPQPQPRPQPPPQPTPPNPTPVPPTPNVTPAPPSPVQGTIAPANCWVIVVVPDLQGQGDALGAIERSTAIRQALNYQFAYCDPVRAPASIADAISRASADALPRMIVLDQSKGLKRVVGSYPVVSEADMLTTIKGFLGPGK